MTVAPPPAPDAAPCWAALAAWVAGGLVIVFLRDRLDLANLALLLVLTAVVASLWQPPWVSVSACAASVLAFNVALVPPRGSLTVDLRAHALLLVTMLGVSTITSLLMARLRDQRATAHAAAAESRAMRELADRLRDASDPVLVLEAVREALAGSRWHDVVVRLAPREPMPPEADADGIVGEASAHEREGLRLAAQTIGPMGPGTGRHEEQPAWYLPVRGRGAAHGAILVRLTDGDAASTARREHAQAVADLLGTALDRADAIAAAARAQASEAAQRLRATLLAAVAHDHRTPLATILGAASSLHDQHDRLDPASRRRLAATIVDEAGQLARLTENTLQLARLDSPGAALRTDWESVEELVGAALRRWRGRVTPTRLRARVEPGLPLLRCDAVLLVQLLDNLIDNALTHGGDMAPVEVVARRVGDRLLLAVRDRGPGVPPADREAMFEPFRRGATAARGAGLGLALAATVARLHGGTLTCRARARGGAAFELHLPWPQAAPGATESVLPEGTAR